MKAAHQLPLLIDLFIFIYFLRKKEKKKKREHSLYPSCDQSQAAGILDMYILIEKKTLKNLKGTAFEHQVTVLFQLQNYSQNGNGGDVSQCYSQQRSGTSRLVFITKCDGSDLHPAMHVMGQSG